MLKVERFVNELMTSNCYLVYDEDTKRCLIIDPGSEKSLREIEFIEDKNLTLDYIIITHEHTDHNWGVNSLREKYPKSKMVCSEVCSKAVKKTNRVYFLLYYDDPDYRYEIAPADVLVGKQEESLQWDDIVIRFVLTPGHSKGGMCVNIENMLFTGDTIMPYKPYFNGRDSNEDDWDYSILIIKMLFPDNTIIYPGHGETFYWGDWNNCSLKKCEQNSELGDSEG